MPPKLDENTIIEKINNILKKENYVIYDNKFEFKTVSQKIEIKCLNCENIFIRSINNIINDGVHCEECKRVKRQLVFLNKCKKIYKDKFLYDEIYYINALTKIKVICTMCGVVNYKRPCDLLDKNYKCQCEKTYGRRTTKEFIELCKKKHGDLYDYSETIYNGSHEKVKVFCKKCQDYFFPLADNHLRSSGYPACGIKEMILKQTKSIDDVIKEFVIVHGNNYFYYLDTYISANKKIKIKCNKCGYDFFQQVNSHLRGSGCPKCNFSKGELKIEKYLKNNEIQYIAQKRFKNCKYKYTLPFDFYLPKLNICIEYDGEHHYKPIFQDELESCQIRDNIKTEFCFVNKIKLIRISYWDFDNIENILNNEFNNYTCIKS